MRIFKAVFFWIGIILTGVLIFAIVFEYTSENSFCASCHIMNKPVSSWQVSSHMNIACVDCHLPKPIFDKAKAKTANGIKEVYKTIFGNPKLVKGQGQPKDEKCLSCHSKGKYNLIRNGIRITHRQHSKQKGMTCTFCHWESAHGISSFAGKKKMTRCTDCHKKKKKSLECNTCHKR